ncbi:MAG: hypothetical protein OZ921_20120 [Sorangiineae bacterium]|nr:hypothetical protein [Polyangiaceae bacterium]MEB2324832.1 hypothetical protein [Sorangiineae bacterium]
MVRSSLRFAFMALALGAAGCGDDAATPDPPACAACTPRRLTCSVEGFEGMFLDVGASHGASCDVTLEPNAGTIDCATGQLCFTHGCYDVSETDDGLAWDAGYGRMTCVPYR